MVKIEINAIDVLVKTNLSVLEACKVVGRFLPRFCYHETLSVSGNCRMCLVEIQGLAKPMTACALPVLANMKIWLHSPMVRKARENIIEALLIHHPLDCPICDQGGECDLQDQASRFGTDRTRSFFNKRSVVDKNFSFFILGIMTRCIHCTRCVRFTSELSCKGFLGTLNRGVATEIGNYHTFFNQETFLSGNIIDLCPVGALTSKSYNFKARPWELKSVESIDLTDGLGCNIYINFKETEIVRILPKINANLNGSFISDKARFFFDALSTYRVFSGYMAINNTLVKTAKIRVLEELEQFIFSVTFTVVVISAENAYELFLLLKHLSYKFAYSLQIKTISTLITNSNIKIDNSVSFLNNLNIANLVVLISLNLQLENSVLNSKLRQKFLLENISIFGVINSLNIDYPVTFLNFSSNSFINILSGKSQLLPGYTLLQFKPFFIFGESFYLRGFNSELIGGFIKKYIPTSRYITIRLLSNNFGLEKLAIKQIVTKDFSISNFILLVNLIDTFQIARCLMQKKSVYASICSFGSKLARISNFIIPVSTVFEQGSHTFFNLEGRPQQINSQLSFNSSVFSIVNVFKFCYKYSCCFLEMIICNIKKENNVLLFLSKTFNVLRVNDVLKISTYPFKNSITDFFLSSVFTQTSKILAAGSQHVRKININVV